MATLERTYNIPLRKEFMKAPRYKRANKAMKALREFLAKHMKSDHIIIGKYLNQKMWERSIKNPPHHVKVTAVKDEKGTVMAELVGAPKPQPKDEKEKAGKPKKKAEEAIQKETEELKEALSGELKKAEVGIKAAEAVEIVKPVDETTETKAQEKPKTEKTAEEKKQKEAVPKAEKKPAETAEKKTAVKKPAKAKKEAEQTA